MGTLKNGRKNGKIGDMVAYELYGKTVVRSIGKSTKPPTELQEAARQKVKVISAFLNPIMEFIAVGYELEVRRLKRHPQNPAFSFIHEFGLAGRYPRFRINFKKVLLSRGTMPIPTGVHVAKTEEGLNFSWGLQEKVNGTHWSDQVMLMAYFPKLRKAVYLTAGACRYKENDLLPIFDIPRGNAVETYIAFIANDRKTISNSLYLGRMIW